MTQKKIAYLQSKRSLKDLEVYRLIKEFFKEYLHAHYEFTFDELVKELDKVYIEKKLRENVYKLLRDFSTIEYKDEEMPQETLQQVLSTFSKLVDALIKSPSEKKQGFLSKLFGNGKGPEVKQAPSAASTETTKATREKESSQRAEATGAAAQATPEEPAVPEPAPESQAPTPAQQHSPQEEPPQAQQQEKPSQVPPSMQETPQEEQGASSAPGESTPVQGSQERPSAEELDVPEPHKQPPQEPHADQAEQGEGGQEAEDGFQLPDLPGEPAAQSHSQESPGQPSQEQQAPGQPSSSQERQNQPQQATPQDRPEASRQETGSPGSLFPEEADPEQDEQDSGQAAGASAGWAEDPDDTGREDGAGHPDEGQEASAETSSEAAQEGQQPLSGTDDKPQPQPSVQPATSEKPAEESAPSEKAEQQPLEARPHAERSHDFYFGEDERQLSQDLDALAHQLDDVIHSDEPQQAQQQGGQPEPQQQAPTQQGQVGTADTLQQLVTTVERLIVERRTDEAKSTYKELIGRYHALPEHAKHAYYEQVNRLYELLQRHG
ncbi:MAG: hypothetical protein ACLFO2_03765 [Candidatus Woesearchaeota archaeon]